MERKGHKKPGRPEADRKWKITTIRFTESEYLLLKRLMGAAGYTSASGFMKDRLFNYENTVREKTLNGTQEDKRNVQRLIEDFDYKAALQGYLASFESIRKAYVAAARAFAQTAGQKDYFGNDKAMKAEECVALMSRLESRARELAETSAEILSLMKEAGIWKA